jgi:hypothetical protein
MVIALYVMGPGEYNTADWGQMGEGEYHWFDEFDPHYLHLGKAVGVFEKRGLVYFREFEDGWVAVNGEDKDAIGVKVPAGSARILDHRNFKAWRAAPLQESLP